MTEKKQRIPAGTVKTHKMLGRGVVQQTNYALHQMDDSYIYFKPDHVPEGWAPVVLVDVEALT